ncbi:MAG: hypothetical protein U1D55_13920 [Phycisphaerae bacterium]
MPAPRPDPTPNHISLVCSQTNLTIEARKGEGETETMPRFAMVAYTGEAMRVEGWRHPVVVDLDGLSVPSQRRPVRFGHDMHAGIGHTERIGVDGGRLVAEGLVSRDTAAAREVVVSGKRGFPWQASIGATVQQSELIRPGKFVTVNGRSFEGPVYVARKASLGEISFVDLGADGNTSVQIAAQKETQVMDDHENPKPTESAGTEAAPTTSAGTDADAGPDIQAARRDAANELRRQAAIRKICGERFVEIAAKAIEENWTVEKTELEVLRAGRPKAPGIITGGHEVAPFQVLEAAVYQAGRLEARNEQFDARVRDAAYQRFHGRIGLQELLLEAAWANGYSGRSFKADMRGVLQAAFSTNTLPGILSSTANKFLLEGFEGVEASWRAIAAIRTVQDFKAVTSYRLTGGFEYLEVGPDGELKHATVGEQSFTNQARTYGRMFSITREHMINDDLGALTAVPRRLGRGAALKLNDVFWTAFLNNAAFFTAGNKNFASGADTALGIDSLSKAEELFFNQTDPDGYPLAVDPALLLVPNALFVSATQLMNSTEIREDTGGVAKKFPTSNPHAGKFRVARSSYLSNTKYTGNSTKAWYLLADANDLPVIEVAFLNGREQPTVESADADFNVLGIQVRGYHDFGVALQDFRGGVKLKGEA